MDRQKIRLGIVALCSAVLLAAAPLTASAEESTAETGGIGAAAGLGSLIYAPVKVVYALGGTVVGGLAWLFSAGDNEVAVPIWNRSVRGDYVLTPAHIRGQEPIQFFGHDDQPAVASAPPDAAYPPPSQDPAW